MLIHRVEGSASTGFTSAGSLWEMGTLFPGKTSFKLQRNGESYPLQSRVTALWPDGSIKWASHVFDSEMAGDEAAIVPVKNDDGIKKDTVTEENGSNEITAIENKDSIIICAGKTRLTVHKSGDALFHDFIYDFVSMFNYIFHHFISFLIKLFRNFINGIFFLCYQIRNDIID